MGVSNSHVKTEGMVDVNDAKNEISSFYSRPPIITVTLLTNGVHFSGPRASHAGISN